MMPRALDLEYTIPPADRELVKLDPVPPFAMLTSPLMDDAANEDMFAASPEKTAAETVPVTFSVGMFTLLAK